MIPSLHDLGIEKLSVDDRIALAQAIWDSIPIASGPLPLTEAQKAELERRLADDDKNPDNVVPWESVEANVLAKLDQ